jgi:hypothetical protein
MILKFNGLVELGDPYRVDENDRDGSVIIGGRDVVHEIGTSGFEKEVTVGILDERFDGELSVETGWVYSEYTPMDPDVLRVGGHDLIEILSRYAGKEITMFVADEPFNILD